MIYTSINNLVYGQGPRDSNILFLGEAPAKTELKEGRPFAGKAGQQFDDILRRAGLQRSNIYVTNASLRPIDGPKDRHFIEGGRPSPAFLEGLIALRDDIAEIKPNVIVPMGNWALQAVMGHQEILKWRGSILWSPIFQCKVIPTIHPAALLYEHESLGDDDDYSSMWKFKSVMVWDFERARQQSAFPELRLRPRTVVVDPQGAALDEALDRLSRAQALCFDLESFGRLNLACIGFSDCDPEWACVLPNDHTSTRMAQYRMLLESDTPKRGQNLCTYDLTFLDQLGIYTRNLEHDTMIAAGILMPQLPKKLEFLTSIYTDIPYYKFEGQVWKTQPQGRDLQMFYNYCGKDVCATSEIAEIQQFEIKERKLHYPFNIATRIVGPLRESTRLGIRCDLNQLMAFMNETQEKLAVAQAEMNTLAGHELNVNSPKQVGSFLYDERKLPERKKDGKRTTDAKILGDLAARTGDPGPRLIIKTRRLRKLLSNYYTVNILSPDGRVRSVRNPVGTVSLRLSSSEPLWGPGCNDQNLPYRHGSKARRMLVADDGFEILECDQVQAEAIVTAYLANDPIHMDCFRTGKDVHRVTACLLTDQPVGNWKQIAKPSQIRDLAKVCNHELNYGAGPIMFMYTVNDEYDPDDSESVKLDTALAKGLHSKYHETRPALRAWWGSIQRELKDNQMTLRSVHGWECQFLDRWSDKLLRDAYSWKPQHTVGLNTNIGILQVYDSEDPDIRYLFKNGFRLVNQVHDSSGWHLPLGAREYVPKIMRLLEVPVNLNGYAVTIPIEAAAGPSLYKGDMDNLGVSRTSCEEGYG